jgi:hypothetical protein
MASYAIFDEQYYLSQYPWVKPAIDAGVLKSGKEHFETFGQAAGLTQVSRYFDEATYLAGNPDIAALVRTPNNPNAPFATGLDHFIQYGYEEGRSQVSPEYDEAFYVANNRQLQPFIQNGTFKNGYQHFIQFGIKDGQFGTSFLETEYLQKNPDIVPFVESGALKTGREHYFNFGKNDPNRSATFVGSSGNDVLTGVGVGNTELIGVEVGIDPQGNRQYESFGSDESDVLIGGPGKDTFVLGVPATSGTPTSRTLYGGITGIVTIRNFDKDNDKIQLAGSPASYTTSGGGNQFLILSPRYDTIGSIEGGGDLVVSTIQQNGNDTFYLFFK